MSVLLIDLSIVISGNGYFMTLTPHPDKDEGVAVLVSPEIQASTIQVRWQKASI